MRHIVERTKMAERRPEEQSEKVEGCPENLLNEIQLKGKHLEKHRRGAADKHHW